MYIILHGPPCSGKGTQAYNICKQLGIVAISTGDLIRAEIKQGTELGKAVREYSSAGEVVPDDVVMKILAKRLEQDDASNGALFDGFPRTEKQAQLVNEWLTQRGRFINAVFVLHITEAEVLFRYTYRLRDPQTDRSYHIYYHKLPVLARSEADQTPIFCSPQGNRLIMPEGNLPEVIQRRLDAYRMEREPLLERWKTEFNYDVYHVDGMLSIDEITENINSIIAEHLVSEGIGFS